MSETANTIWCLFSVDNNYDQPDNNLVRFWYNKPSIETLAKFMACPLDKATDEDITRVVQLWTGERVTGFSYDTTCQYRLQAVTEGKAP